MAHYAARYKCAFNLPNWVFPPAWSVLYVQMAIAAWRAWKRDGQNAAIVEGQFNCFST
ncbi:TspO/MBR family protein [Paraburkholderia caffeinilytica]|uniref:TspO/MBR family protein n=1 Tax=Paraburkholderia caffeinilytica TaxID=1761016 RepID=UPI0038BAC393